MKLFVRVAIFGAASVVAAAGAFALLAATGRIDVRVTSEPSGAEVYVDGRPAGRTPLVLHGMDDGDHDLRLAHAECFDRGYALRLADIGRWRRSLLRMHRTVMPVRVSLDAVPRGEMLVTSEPTGAEVRLAGEAVGATPLRLRELRAGRHGLQLLASGFDPWSQAVEVENNAPAKVHAQLRSRSEAYYLARIKSKPNDLVAYTELIHHYLVVGNFAAATKNLDPAVKMAGALPDGYDEKSRFFQELEKICTRQYDYPENDAAKAFRGKVVDCVRKLAQEYSGSQTIQRAYKQVVNTN